MPFSRCTVCFGEPLFLDSDLSDESIDKACRDIGTALAELEAKADAYTGRAKN
jgi:lysophospholipid acyltransferase (LPLAT)-like uncharacterized protein